MAVKPGSRWQYYRLADWLTQGYLAIVGVLILILHGSALPLWPWYALAHVVLLVAIDGLIRWHSARPDQRVVGFLRHFYPVLLYTFLYGETGSLNHLLETGYLDAHLLRWDLQMFGGLPNVSFMVRLPYLPVSELFYASYFSYYIMIPGVGIALFIRQRVQFQHYLTVMSFVFYVCYLTYIFTPVMGPPILDPRLRPLPLPPDLAGLTLPEIPATIQSGPFFQVMAYVYRHFEAPGAAFPSSHVAVALCTLYFSFRYLRRIRIPHSVMVILLSLATVYCRYHYVADVIAGTLAASVLIPLGNWLYARFGKAGFIQDAVKNSPVPAARSSVPN
jgi:membrane-associated phospholipid phosphatase